MILISKDLIGELLSRNDNLNIDVILDVPMDGRNSAWRKNVTARNACNQKAPAQNVQGLSD